MFKKILYMVLISVGATAALAADVGVSITVGQPGFYGQIDIGHFPPARVVYVQPVIVHRAPEIVAVAPIYLHVPPGHEKHWSKHCAQYNACGRPVFFVRDDWYNNVYVPQYRSKYAGHDHGDHGKGGNDDHDHGHGQDHQDGHDNH